MNISSNLTAQPAPPLQQGQNMAQRLAGPEGAQDYLMRQATRIMMAGGSQGDVLRYLRDIEGVKFDRPIPDDPNPSVWAQANAPRSPTSNGSFDFAGLDPSFDYNHPIPSGLALNVINGATFGFGDEGLGTLYGLATGIGGQAGRDAYRTTMKESSPGEALAGQFIGALATGHVTGGFLKQLGVGAGTGMLGRIGMSAVAGGAVGAAAGAGNAEGGLSERTKAAVVGGLTGAALAGSLTGVAKVTAAATKATAATIQSWLPAFRGAQNGPASLSARQLWAQAVERAGGFNVVEQKARDAFAQGAPFTMVDATGDAGASLMQASSGFRTPQSQKMVEEIITRQANQPGRMLGQFFRRLRLGSENAYEAVERLQEEQITNSAPLYEKAHQEMVGVGQAMKKLLQSPLGRDAYEEGRNLALMEDYAGVQNKGALPVPALQYAEGTTNKLLDTQIPVRAMDYVQRGLRSLAEKYRNSPTAITSEMERPVRQMVNDALKEVDAQSQSFAAARAAWAGPEAAQEAVNTFKAKFNQMNPSVVEAEIKRLAPSVRPYAVLGAAQRVADDAMSLKAVAPDVATQIFGGRSQGGVTPRYMEQRIRALFQGDDAAAQEFYDYVRAETQMSMSARATGGSRTTPMREAMDEIRNAASPMGGGVSVSPVIRPSPTGVALSAYGRFRNRAATGFAQSISNEVSEGALRGMNGPAEFFAYLNSLRNYRTPFQAAPAITIGSLTGRETARQLR